MDSVGEGGRSGGQDGRQRIAYNLLTTQLRNRLISDGSLSFTAWVTSSRNDFGARRRSGSLGGKKIILSPVSVPRLLHSIIPPAVVSASLRPVSVTCRQHIFLHQRIDAGSGHVFQPQSRAPCHDPVFHRVQGPSVLAATSEGH